MTESTCNVRRMGDQPRLLGFWLWTPWKRGPFAEVRGSGEGEGAGGKFLFGFAASERPVERHVRQTVRGTGLEVTEGGWVGTWL